MEVVGGVASIITLIEATGVLIEVSKKLISRWQNAPHEIQALATRLSLLAGELHSIKNATSTSHLVLTDAIIRQSLSDLLTDVRKRLMKLESLHFRLEQHKPVYQRIRWTVKDASSVEKMLSKTQEVEQRLANLMTLISLKAQRPIMDGLDRIERLVSTLVVSLPASTQGVSMSSTKHPTSGSAAHRTRSALTVRRTAVTSRWTLNEAWESWGLRGQQVTTRNASHIDRNVNFSIAIPLAQILGNYIFLGNLSMQTTSLYWGLLTFRHPSYFAVARVVEDHHPFMKACEEGDIETVRLMLRSAEGRPTDVTTYGRTPIWFAVRGRKIGVIKELLDCGTDVDALSDIHDNLTALEVALVAKELDTVQYLLQHGASADRRFANGLRSSALCWWVSDHATEHSSMEIFKLFLDEESLDQEGIASEATSILAKAVAFCCDSQITQLIRLGADVYHGLSCGKAPIHFAAFRGNFLAYSALVSYHDDPLSEPGYAHSSYLLLVTMTGKARQLDQSQKSHHLQIDGTHDYNKILLDLLHRGANPKVRLKLPYWTSKYTTSGTEAQEVDMDELAGLLGPETEAWYLSILGSFYSRSARQRARVTHELITAEKGTPEFVDSCGEELDVRSVDVRLGSQDLSEQSSPESNDVEELCIDLKDDSVDGEDDDAEQFWDAGEIA